MPFQKETHLPTPVFQVRPLRFGETFQVFRNFPFHKAGCKFSPGFSLKKKKTGHEESASSPMRSTQPMGLFVVFFQKKKAPWKMRGKHVVSIKNQMEPSQRTPTSVRYYIELLDTQVFFGVRWSHGSDRW